MLRILYIHQYFSTPGMSFGTRSHEISRRLARRGHRVTMITSAQAGHYRYEQRIEGVDVIWLPIRYSQEMSYVRRLTSFGGFAAAAAYEALRHDCDIVYATSTPLTVALPGAVAARRHRVPMVLEVRDLWPEMPIAIGALTTRYEILAARALERFAYRRSRHIVALSPGMAQGICEAGVDPSKVSVVPNGCDIEEFGESRTASPPDALADPRLTSRRIALYAGAIGRVNRLEYLVDVARSLRTIGSELALVVVGDGAEKNSLVTYAQQADVLNKYLFVLPPQPKRDMPHFFAWSDIALSIFALIPEMEANSSNKFFDALAAGKPVAVNYGGWHRQLIEERRCGIYLPPEPDKAAALLDRLAADDSWLTSAGYASRQLAIEQFSRDGQATRIEEILARAVADTSGYV